MEKSETKTEQKGRKVKKQKQKDNRLYAQSCVTYLRFKIRRSFISGCD